MEKIYFSQALKLLPGSPKFQKLLAINFGFKLKAGEPLPSLDKSGDSGKTEN